MNIRWILPSRVWWTYCVSWFARQLQAAPDIQTLRAGEAIDLALHPPRIALHMLSVAQLLCLIAAADFLFESALLSAACMLLGLPGAQRLRRQLAPKHHALARRLLVTADGHIYAICADGRVDAVTLRPGSMRLGTGLLLRMQGERQHLLLLSDQNTDPGGLAVLRRRLRHPSPEARMLGLDSGRVHTVTDKITAF
jgi:hypothetical protein